MRPARDFCQRKVYGVIRTSMAIIRLGKAETKAEREKAGDWVVAWVSLGGIRHLKANRVLNKRACDKGAAAAANAALDHAGIDQKADPL
jgi:hypothetical protein